MTADLDNINLDIKCEIGQVRLNLGQLTQLKIGDTLELEKFPALAKLSINGNYFAEGYLVEINGLLGVKISQKIAYTKEKSYSESDYV